MTRVDNVFWDLLVISFFLSCAKGSENLPAPVGISAHQVWPGEVQVIWEYDENIHVSFEVRYKPVDAVSWCTERVSETHLLTLKDLIAYTNYSVQVCAVRAGRAAAAAAVTVYVMDGVPNPPYDLAYRITHSLNTSLVVMWQQKDMHNTLGFQLQLLQRNQTRLATTTLHQYTFQDVENLDDWFAVRVYALNSVGRSPGGYIEKTVSLPILDPAGRVQEDTRPRVNLNVIYALCGVLGFVAIIALLFAAVIHKRRTYVSRHSYLDDTTSGQPFLVCQSQDIDRGGEMGPETDVDIELRMSNSDWKNMKSSQLHQPKITRSVSENGRSLSENFRSLTSSLCGTNNKLSFNESRIRPLTTISKSTHPCGDINGTCPCQNAKDDIQIQDQIGTSTHLEDIQSKTNIGQAANTTKDTCKYTVTSSKSLDQIT